MARGFVFVDDDNGREVFIDRPFVLLLLAVHYPDPLKALDELERAGGLRVFGADIRVREEVANND